MRFCIIIAISTMIASGLCAQVTTNEAGKLSKQINTLFSDYTDTTVFPTDGNDAVIVFSGKILTDQKDLWIFVSACAIGKHLNDNPSTKINELWFADVGEMKSNPKKCQVLSAEVAKSVQSRVHSGDVELKDGMRLIKNGLSNKIMTK